MMKAFKDYEDFELQSIGLKEIFLDLTGQNLVEE